MQMPSKLVAALVLGLVPGCARAVEGEPVAEPAAPAEAAPAPAPAPMAARAAGAPLAFVAPAGWVAETPTSSMRKAQYRVPRSAGDAEDGECVVYHFGAGGGGGVEANVERWCAQFEQPDGRDSQAVLVRAERQVAGRVVHEVELSGTYVAETAPGSGVRVNKPEFAMRGAIVESDHGAYYVKLVGPAATVAQHAAAFRELLASAR